MNADLERTLEGMDPDMRAFAAALRAAPQAKTEENFTKRTMAAIRSRSTETSVPRRHVFSRLVASSSIAAGLVVLLGIGVLFRRSHSEETAENKVESTSSVPGAAIRSLVDCQRNDGSFSSTSASKYVQAFAVAALAKDPAADAGALKGAVDALVREQGADGGWANARLSAYNVLALHAASDVGVEGARLAYKRGRRYLHAHGIGERTLADLVREARKVHARLDASSDPGLVRSVSLCASM